MKFRNLLLATASLATAVCITGSVSAQNNRPARPPEPAEKRRHLLYIAVPGDRGDDGQSGVIVLDADHDYNFIKRISYGLPASMMPGPKISGMTSSVPENKIYVTTDGGQMIAFDLATDKISWIFKGEGKGDVVLQRPGSAKDGCCERPWTMPGGHQLLVASSYNKWWWLINAKTGKIEGRIDTPEAPRSHNVTVTADGKLAAMASLSPAPDAKVAIVDVPSRKVLRYITFSDAPRPLTMNWDGSLIYVNVNNLDGFEIADTKTGKMIKRVELPGEMWKDKWANPNGHFFGHGLPSHGIGMTPDQSEIWVTDAANDAWQVWDNPGDGRNPVYNPAKTVKVQPNVGSAWISMTNDGKTAFVGDGSVIDVRAHKVTHIMKDEYGRPIHAVEKMLLLTFNEEGKLLETTNQFAMGDEAATKARLAREGNPGKQASNQ
jgi:DNA-binding beta-propeller fold protein YncE